MLPIIISFYTNDWEYPKHADRLKKECRELHLQHDIQELKSAGGYLENTRMKPKFILDMLRKHKRPVLWIDVDGSIYQSPTFFDDLTCDFAARPKVGDQADGRMWHVGTLWFNYTEKAIKFLEAWVELSTEVSDESALQDLWQSYQDVECAQIPREYHELMIRNWQKKPSTVIAHRISNGISKRQQAPIWNTTKLQADFKSYEPPAFTGTPYHVCIMKSGGDFTADHVRWLAKQVPNLICLSDIEIEGVPTIKLQKNWTGWWSKIELFSDILNGDLLYFDLDTVINCDVKELYVGKTTVLRDFYHRTKMGSGLMYISQRDKSKIWKTFSVNPQMFMSLCTTRERWGDQGFLQDFIGDANKWQDSIAGIYSYKVHCQQGLPSDAKVICFHGKPRPWELEKTWIPRLE